MPEWEEPTLAKLAHDYSSDPGWIFEPKLDGRDHHREACVKGWEGLRRDKDPEDVHREVESQTADLQSHREGCQEGTI